MIRWSARSKKLVTVPEGGYDCEAVGDSQTMVTNVNSLAGRGFGKLIVGFARKAAAKDVNALAERIKAQSRRASRLSLLPLVANGRKETRPEFPPTQSRFAGRTAEAHRRVPAAPRDQTRTSVITPPTTVRPPSRTAKPRPTLSGARLAELESEQGRTSARGRESRAPDEDHMPDRRPQPHPGRVAPIAARPALLSDLSTMAQRPTGTRAPPQKGTLPTGITRSRWPRRGQITVGASSEGPSLVG